MGLNFPFMAKPALQPIGFNKINMNKKQEKEHIDANTISVEYNELVFSRMNPKFIYKRRDAQKRFSDLKIGDRIYWKQDNFIWVGEIIKKSGNLKVYVY